MKQARNIFGASHNCLSPPSDNSMAFSGKPQMAAGTVQFSGAKFHMESPKPNALEQCNNVFLNCPIVCKHAKCADVPDVQNLTRCAKCFRPGVCKMCKRCKMCSTMAGPPSTTGSGLTSWLLSPIKSALQQICSFQWGQHWRAHCTWHCRKWGQPSKPPPPATSAPPSFQNSSHPSTPARHLHRSAWLYICLTEHNSKISSTQWAHISVHWKAERTAFLSGRLLRVQRTIN